jgi:hypothetical protein
MQVEQYPGPGDERAALVAVDVLRDVDLQSCLGHRFQNVVAPCVDEAVKDVDVGRRCRIDGRTLGKISRPQPVDVTRHASRLPGVDVRGAVVPGFEALDERNEVGNERAPANDHFGVEDDRIRR